MRTISEVSRLTGVSVRALHHYDAIGLLKPAQVTEAGYRLYDDTALERLQSILMFRELQFPLKEIKKLLESPSYDSEEALKQQIRLLELKQKQLEKLIAFARALQSKGADYMNFEAFDKTELDQYADEVRKKWGDTDAYRAFKQKTEGKSDQELAAGGEKILSLFAKIGSLKELPPDDERVQKKITELQTLITENYYHCTDEILAGLGQMYVCDERMKKNIDRAGGEGTASFAAKAISIYTGNRQL